MKIVNFSKKSWHFHIASEYGGLNAASYYTDEDDSTRCYDLDICTYIRAVGVGFLILLLICGLVLFLAYPMVDMCAWFLSGMYHSFVDPEPPAAVSLFVLFAVVLHVAGSTICKMIKAVVSSSKQSGSYKDSDEYYYQNEKKQSSFFVSAYRKFKDKTCVRVTIT